MNEERAFTRRPLLPLSPAKLLGSAEAPPSAAKNPMTNVSQNRKQEATAFVAEELFWA